MQNQFLVFFLGHLFVSPRYRGKYTCVEFFFNVEMCTSESCRGPTSLFRSNLIFAEVILCAKSVFSVFSQFPRDIAKGTHGLRFIFIGKCALG